MRGPSGVGYSKQLFEAVGQVAVAVDQGEGLAIPDVDQRIPLLDGESEGVGMLLREEIRGRFVCGRDRRGVQRSGHRAAAGTEEGV